MRLPWAMILILAVLAIVTDVYINFDIRSYLSGRRRRIALWVYNIISLLCYGLLAVTICMPKRDNAQDIIPMMWMLYTFLTIYSAKIIYVICSEVGRLARRVFRRKRDAKNYCAIAGISLAVITFCVMWWGVFFTRRDIKVEHLDLRSERIPAAFDGYKIVQFSDAHVGTWGKDTTFVSSLVERINSLDPDLVVFTGDIVNRETTELEPFLGIFSKIRARDGVYSILGNHDYGDYIDWPTESAKQANLELMKVWQRQIGWRLLNNERAAITHDGDSIMIIGVENWGEPPFKQYGRLTDAYPLDVDSAYNLNDSRFKILLSHNPEHWRREVSKISNVDLTLAGHTHAMQMMVNIGGWKWSPAAWKYPNWEGLYQEESTQGTPMELYVNIGSGEVGIPTRIGAAYPELTEIVLHRVSENRGK